MDLLFSAAGPSGSVLKQLSRSSSEFPVYHVVPPEVRGSMAATSSLCIYYTTKQTICQVFLGFCYEKAAGVPAAEIF